MWKVLVVDDNAANRMLLVEILDGHALCDTAVDGQDAMTQYQLALSLGIAYDMVLLDIAMPEVDGIEFLKYVRDTEANAGVPTGEGMPIIMVTAFEKPFMKAFNSGCDDYILKPVDATTLLQKMKVKLAGRK
jgi:two-component system chemotaxis response regulator CheY